MIIEVICATTAAAAGLITFRLIRNYRWKYRDDTKLYGKTVVLTGGNSGIGFATAEEMVKRGAYVIIGCRDEKKAMEAVENIKKKLKFQDTAGGISYMHLDLKNFDSVKQFADFINKSEERLDILVNNAAVFGSPFETSANGFESSFTVNHLSSSLLTLLLLPKLASSGNQIEKSRIIMVTSTLLKRGVIRDVDFTKGYYKIIINSVSLSNCPYLQGCQH